jgi:hypothetical protein
MEGRIESRVEGEAADELCGWASLWLDLMHVDMVLGQRAQLPVAPTNVFARRGLWEAATAAYGRTAMSGRRQQRILQLVSLMGDEANRIHESVLSWRNQHVAHRVDGDRELTEARAIIEGDPPEIKAIRVRVSPVGGPEEEEDDLASAFAAYIYDARNLVWESKMPTLEQALIQELVPSVGSIVRHPTPMIDIPSTRFVVDIDPDGGDEGSVD